MLKTASITRVALLGLVLCTSWAVRAQAQSVGIVDEDKLADGYKQYKDAVDKLDQRAQTLDKEVPAREFLTDDEGKKFDTIIIKPTLTAEEQKTLEDLITTGNGRKDDFTNLIGKAARTPDETKRMKDLQAQVDKNKDAVHKISDDLLQAIRKMQDDTDADYTNRANSVVAQVAATRKLLIVVRKRAVVWSADSVDITTDVLAQLNK